jgi:hypothetical protein
MLVQVFSKWFQVHGRTASSFFNAERDRAMEEQARDDASDARARVQHTSTNARGGVLTNTSAVVAKLIGGVGRAPIQLSSMAQPMSAPPEAVEWLDGVQLDEGSVDDMQTTLTRADTVRGPASLLCSASRKLLPRKAAQQLSFSSAAGSWHRWALLRCAAIRWSVSAVNGKPRIMHALASSVVRVRLRGPIRLRMGRRFWRGTRPPCKRSSQRQAAHTQYL